MIVGIMSMQRVCNYGSFLQAYGLKKTIESMGHSVVFVDYKIGKPLCVDKRDRAIVLKKRIINSLLSFLIRIRILDFLVPAPFRYSIKQNRIYSKACKDFLGFGSKKKYNSKVDILIIGSDEVFNCTQLNPNVGFSPELFGLNNNASLLISYAASFGNTSFDKIVSLGKEEELKRYLRRFSFISVRDKNSSFIVKSLVGNTPFINLDPALIYDFGSAVQHKCTYNNFVIVYAYRNRLTKLEKKFIKKYAEEHNKKIVCIGGYQEFGDFSFIGTPLEVLDYFAKTDYVFTDTFHGTIMAIINHKPFLSFVRYSENGNYGNAEKIIDLLNRLHLSHRLFNCNGSLCSVIDEDINYELVDSVLREEKNNSVDYLERCFNSCE